MATRPVKNRWPKRGSKPDWARHFDWLKKQPVSETNPVDELRKTDKR
jgi:hypothetical protein